MNHHQEKVSYYWCWGRGVRGTFANISLNIIQIKLGEHEFWWDSLYILISALKCWHLMCISRINELLTNYNKLLEIILFCLQILNHQFLLLGKTFSDSPYFYFKSPFECHLIWWTSQTLPGLLLQHSSLNFIIENDTALFLALS